MKHIPDRTSSFALGDGVIEGPLERLMTVRMVEGVATGDCVRRSGSRLAQGYLM